MSAEVDVTDWRTAERLLTTWPAEVEGLGCSSFETRFVLEAPLRDVQAEVTAASCKAPVVAQIVTRWPAGSLDAEGRRREPRRWPVCEEHLAWHRASDLVRSQLIIGEERLETRSGFPGGPPRQMWIFQ